MWAPGGRPRVAVTIRRGEIIDIELVAGAESLRLLDWSTDDD
jgi:hypothetical protein